MLFRSIGGQIVYSAAAKIRLGVPAALIEEFTPVSAEVTQELAIRCRESYGTDYALAITGNAGPTADAGGKPVGLVHLACASAHGVVLDTSQFRGTREDIRARATQWALILLRNEMTK